MKTMDKSSVVKNALARKVVTEKHLLERVAQSPGSSQTHISRIVLARVLFLFPR